MAGTSNMLTKRQTFVEGNDDVLGLVKGKNAMNS